MKKKFTVNTLALGNLKARKKQYAIMLIGIILAMVFSSGILFYIFSAVDTQYAEEQEKYGKQNIIMYLKGVDEQYYENMSKDGIFTDYGFAHTIGYAYTDADNAYLGTSVAWLDDKAQQLSNQIFINGAYPTAENEIAIEKTALRRMGYKDAQVGDMITVYMNVQNDDGYYKTVQKNYKLSGILSDKRLYLQSMQSDSLQFDDDIPAAFVAQNSNTEFGGREKLIAYANLDYSRIDVENEFYSSIEQLNLEDDEYYTNVCNALKSFTSISNEGRYAILLSSALVLTSAIVIINSFNSNLNDRKKQIGMLRAVGATKRQIINIFGREAFLIALITSPVAIAISYFAVKYGFKLMNTKLVMTKSFIVLPLCFIVDIAAVMIAALIPLVFASRITPVQAIRDIEKNRKMKNRKIKSKKEFNVSTLIAKRNIGFSKGSVVAVSVILIATIVLSSFGFSYLSYVQKDVFINDFDYQLSCSNAVSGSFYNFDRDNVGFSENDKADISSLDFADSVYGTKRISAYINIDNYTDYFKICCDSYSVFKDSNEIFDSDNWFEQIRSEFTQEYLDDKENFNEQTDMFSVGVFSIDNSVISNIDKSEIEGNIDINKLSSGEEVILVAPKTARLVADFMGKETSEEGCSIYASYDDEIKEDVLVSDAAELPYKVGDEITVNVINYANAENIENNPSDFKKTTKEVTIGAIIPCNSIDSAMPIVPDWMVDFGIITTNEGMNSFYENRKYENIKIFCDDEITEDTDEIMTANLQDYVDMYDAYLTSNFAMVQRQETRLAALFVSMTAIIIVGFAMCTSIINNTLSARIRDSKKEIGTLRAFGADRSELVKSYVNQLLKMFSLGTITGFIIFFLIFGVMYAVTKYRETTMNFVFNPYITVVFVVIMLAVCTVSLFFKIKKEMKNSIIDNIREL